MTAPVIQVKPPVPDVGPLLSIMIANAGRKDRQAKAFFDAMPAGTTLGDLIATEGGAKNFKRFLGIDPDKFMEKVGPGFVFNPRTAAQQDAALAQQTLGTESTAQQVRRGRGVLGQRGAAPVLGSTETDRAAGDAAIARGQRTRAERGAAAIEAQTGAPAEASGLGVFGIQDPVLQEAARSSAILNTASNQLAIEAMQKGNLKLDAALAPLGIGMKEAIIATAQGYNNLLIQAANIRASGNATTAAGRAEMDRILFQARVSHAQEVASRFEGADVAFVLAVLEGNPEVLDTELGQSILSFFAVGLTENMTQRIQSGDRKLAAFTQWYLPIMKEFSGDLKSLEKFTGAVAEMLKVAYEGEEFPEILLNNRGVLGWMKTVGGILTKIEEFPIGGEGERSTVPPALGAELREPTRSGALGVTHGAPGAVDTATGLPSLPGTPQLTPEQIEARLELAKALGIGAN